MAEQPHFRICAISCIYPHITCHLFYMRLILRILTGNPNIIPAICFGLQPLDNNSRRALLQILEDCYQRKSVIITSQLPVSKWYDYINEPTLADSMRRKNQK